MIRRAREWARRRASLIVVLLVVGVLGGGALVAEAVQAGQQRAAQRRQAELIERRLCATLSQLAALTPPPGDPAANPSRGYDQELHATLAQLAPDVGCRG